MKESSELNLEQLEQRVAQDIASFYHKLLGHQLQQVSCKLADQTVTIIAEDSITPVERLLAQNNRVDLVQQVRKSLHKALEPHIQSLIEELVQVPVLDVICNAALDTGRISIVAILAATPEIVYLH